MPKRKVVKRKTKAKVPKYDKKIPSYVIQDSGNRGKLNYVNYNVDEFKNTRRNRIKAIEKIEQFVNDRSKKMIDIPILQNQKVWTTLKFSDGTYSSSRVVDAGSDINVGGIWADYDAKGDARRVVGFTFSFTPLG
jgi:hypothetical protein